MDAREVAQSVYELSIDNDSGYDYLLFTLNNMQDFVDAAHNSIKRVKRDLHRLVDVDALLEDGVVTEESVRALHDALRTAGQFTVEADRDAHRLIQSLYKVSEINTQLHRQLES